MTALTGRPSKKLPRRPNLEHLKKQAKQRLALLRGTEPTARLSNAQLAIAREYGFASWRALHAHVIAAPVPKQKWNVDALPAHRKTHKIAQWKPIMDAAYAGDAEKVAKLLDAGADPNVLSTTPHRYRPLHRAIEHKKTAPKHAGHERVVRVLLERGADPTLRATQAQLTALQLAAMDEPRFVPLLVERFRPLDLFHAIVLQDVKRVAKLVKTDPSIAQSADENGWSTLHYAAASAMCRHRNAGAEAQLQIVRDLLAAGADPMATFAWPGKHHWPMPVMYYSAGRHNNPAVTRLLLEAGATPFDNESVYHAADELHQECLDLFEKMCDPKQLANECTRCLASQFHWNHTAGARWLLEHGADPNAVHPHYRHSALHLAIRNKSSEKILRMLFKHGADVRTRTAEGKTALDLARAAGPVMLERVEAASSG